MFFMLAFYLHLVQKIQLLWNLYLNLGSYLSKWTTRFSPLLSTLKIKGVPKLQHEKYTDICKCLKLLVGQVSKLR
jgi:hypothetical protein